MDYTTISTPNVSEPLSISLFGMPVINNFAWLSQLEVSLDMLASMAPLSGLQAAGLEVGESSGAGTNKPVLPQIKFDGTVSEGRMWTFRMPRTYGGGAVTLKLGYRMGSANTSKAVVMAAQLAAVSDGDASMNAKVFATENTSTISVPDAANTQDEGSITLTNKDNVAAGDWVNLVLYRKPTDGSDNASGDLILTSLDVQFGASAT
jgi:hypothetical protein